MGSSRSSALAEIEHFRNRLFLFSCAAQLTSPAQTNDKQNTTECQCASPDHPTATSGMDSGQKCRRQLGYVRDLLLAALTKSHQVPRAFRTFEYVEIFWIREIQGFGTRNKFLECLSIEASDALRIWIMFQHVILQRVEEDSIVLVVM